MWPPRSGFPHDGDRALPPATHRDYQPHHQQHYHYQQQQQPPRSRYSAPMNPQPPHALQHQHEHQQNGGAQSGVDWRHQQQQQQQQRPFARHDSAANPAQFPHDPRVHEQHFGGRTQASQPHYRNLLRGVQPDATAEGTTSIVKSQFAGRSRPNEANGRRDAGFAHYDQPPASHAHSTQVSLPASSNNVTVDPRREGQFQDMFLRQQPHHHQRDINTSSGVEVESSIPPFVPRKFEPRQPCPNRNRDPLGFARWRVQQEAEFKKFTREETERRAAHDKEVRDEKKRRIIESKKAQKFAEREAREVEKEKAREERRRLRELDRAQEAASEAAREEADQSSYMQNFESVAQKNKSQDSSSRKDSRTRAAPPTTLSQTAAPRSRGIKNGKTAKLDDGHALANDSSMPSRSSGMNSTPSQKAEGQSALLTTVQSNKRQRTSGVHDEIMSEPHGDFSEIKGEAEPLGDATLKQSLAEASQPKFGDNSVFAQQPSKIKSKLNLKSSAKASAKGKESTKASRASKLSHLKSSNKSKKSGRDECGSSSSDLSASSGDDDFLVPPPSPPYRQRARAQLAQSQSATTQAAQQAAVKSRKRRGGDDDDIDWSQLSQISNRGGRRTSTWRSLFAGLSTEEEQMAAALAESVRLAETDDSEKRQAAQWQIEERAQEVCRRGAEHWRRMLGAQLLREREKGYKDFDSSLHYADSDLKQHMTLCIFNIQRLKAAAPIHARQVLMQRISDELAHDTAMDGGANRESNAESLKKAKRPKVAQPKK